MTVNNWNYTCWHFKKDKKQDPPTTTAFKIFRQPISYSKHLTTRIHKTISLPITVYGCQLQGKNTHYRSVTKKILNLRDGELAYDWGKQHNAECHNLHPSPITMVKTRKVRWKNSYINTHANQTKLCKQTPLTTEIRWEENDHYSLTVLCQLT
jgi:hypothetical protein